MAEKDKVLEEEKLQPIIIKRIKKAGAHHGGAWKVAYADFVTAMMAFFLLLWLLNVTTDEERNAISNYFDPTHPKVSEATSGAGGILGGLSMTPKGAMATTVQNITLPQNTRPTSATHTPMTAAEKAVEKAKEDLRKKEDEKFKEAQEKLKKAVEEDPELAKLAKNLLVDMTPEGLRIQIVDQDGESMFASGSAQMYEKTRTLMSKVAQIIVSLPNEVSVRGHTDSVPYPAGAQYTNWELSADRANATRRVLLENNMPKERLNDIVGKADTEHLFPSNPADARNRRISIVLLKEELTNPDFEKKAADKALADNPKLLDQQEESETPPETQQVPVGTFRKTPGQVQFP